MYGIVLEGGGTRGSYEIGAYQAILDSKLQVAGIVGTSIGAINGAMLVQGDLYKAKEVWMNLKASMIMDIDDDEFEKLYNLKFSKSEVPEALSKVKYIIKDGGLDISPLRRNLERYIDEDRIRNSGKDFGIVTYNYSKKEAVEVFIEDIPEGQLLDYIIASSSLPAFKSTEIDGDIYIDGAVHDNLPFKMLEDKGYENIIIVRVNGLGKVNKYDDKDYIVIEPREKLGAVMELDRDKIAYNMKLGYYDTLRVLNSYYGDRYYIKNPCSEEDAFKFFYDLSQDKIELIKEILNIKNDKIGKKVLFEDIIPKLDSVLGIKNKTYLDLLIEVLELKSLDLDLERFQVYEFSDLFNRALVQTKSLSLIRDRGLINSLKDRLFNKEDLAIRIANIIISG